MIRILIADDHAVVRQGLKQIIGETSDMAVADEATNGQEVLKKAWENDYDVILLDIAMPGRSGVDILKQLKAKTPKVPVLMLSIYAEEHFAIRALKLGASGYLTKESASDELIGAIRKVSQGQKYISSSLAEKLAFNLEIGSERPLHETLSDREYQVMCMIASGKEVKEIAMELSLSPKTISTYRFRILKKLNLRNNAELTRYAIQNHLIP